jgi:hypothetical protein
MKRKGIPPKATIKLKQSSSTIPENMELQQWQVTAEEITFVTAMA